MLQLTNTETGKGKGITTPIHNTSSTTIKPSPTDDEVLIIISCVVGFIALFTAVFCYYMVTRCRNSGNPYRQRNESEREGLYQNSNIIKNQKRDSLEIVVNRPLPQPPVEVRQSVVPPLPQPPVDPAVPPAVPEDDYLRPINSFWDRHMEEIRKLPPPPPVFPRQLELLALDGEGAYTPVIPDDEAPILSPGSSHEIARDEQLCELREESGYVVPKSLTETSLQRSLSETDHPPELKEIKHMGSETQMRLRPVVTTPGALQQCPDMSESRSFTRDASLSSATKNKTENSKETKRKTYRSSCHLYLLSST